MKTPTPTLFIVVLFSTMLISCTKMLPVIPSVKDKPVQPVKADTIPTLSQDAPTAVVDSLPLFLEVTSMYTLDQVLTISVDDDQFLVLSSDTGEVVRINQLIGQLLAGQKVKISLFAGTGNMQLQVRKNDLFEADILHNMYLSPGEEKMVEFTVDSSYQKYAIFVLCQV